MSDFGDDGAYGDDISIADSVGSCFVTEREEEDKKKSLYQSDPIEDDEKDAYTVNKDKKALYELFKTCIFQNISNDKLYVLRIKNLKYK